MLKKEMGQKKIKFDVIRKKWDEKTEKWYFSIVDIVSVTTNSTNPRNYWKVLKNRLNTKQNQLVTDCNQLKLQASDGKFYLTDVGDIDTIGEILKIISPQNFLTFKAYALGLPALKEEKISSPSKTKIGNEVFLKNRKESYPQVTYNLAKLLNKNIESSPTISKENSNKKIFKKVLKMRTI